MAPGRRLNIGEALVALPQARIRISANLGGGVQKGGYHMAERREDESRSEEARQIEGLPVVRAQVGGIDLGSQRHWVCAPGLGGRGREIADFGATTPELQRMLEWLKVRQAESVAMESTGVYWIAPQEVLEAGGWRCCWWTRGNSRGCRGAIRRRTPATASGSSGCTVAGC